MRKTSDKIQLKEHPTKYLTCTLQNYPGHENQEKTEKLAKKPRRLRGHDS